MDRTVEASGRKVITVLVGTLTVIAAIVTMVWKLKRHRKKLINSVLASMQQLKQRIPCSVVYLNRSNQDKEEKRLNPSEELEAELIPVKEKTSYCGKKGNQKGQTIKQESGVQIGTKSKGG